MTGLLTDCKSIQGQDTREGHRVDMECGGMARCAILSGCSRGSETLR